VWPAGVGQEAVGVTVGNLPGGRKATNGRGPRGHRRTSRGGFVLLVSVERVAAGATGA
jgi:hypothetical protein